jgi:ComF family protein
MLKRWLNYLRLFFYPEICVLCSKQLKLSEEEICLICEANLPEFTYAFFDGNPVEQLFYNNTPINGANAFLSFIESGKTQRLIHALKYNGRTKIGLLLGEKAANHSLKTNPEYMPEIIIPVPLHMSKERKRGFNQCNYIAEGIANVYKCSIDLNNIKRKHNTSSQTEKNRFERFNNMKEVFTTVDYTIFHNKHVMIVDDVITTGATLNAICEEVLKSRPKSIVVYGIALKI